VVREDDGGAGSSMRALHRPLRTGGAGILRGTGSVQMSAGVSRMMRARRILGP